jgi:hypothetical protein
MCGTFLGYGGVFGGESLNMHVTFRLASQGLVRILVRASTSEMQGTGTCHRIKLMIKPRVSFHYRAYIITMV